MTDQKAITNEQRQRFERDGYFIMERAIPAPHLEMLRDECQRYIDLANERMDRAGVDHLGLDHRGSRYFVSGYTNDRNPRLREFLFSDLMGAVCRATIGSTAYLFYESYVVKAAERGMEFGWHQDSGYVGRAHMPYVSCWCPLDDVDEANGTIYVLPYDRAGTRDVVPHVRDERTGDMVGYFGDDPGVPVIAPAGSVVVFSSLLFHRSGLNTTPRARRIYLAQYSPEPVTGAEGKPIHLAERFL